jgi:non-homologous end joining protein Ku
VIRPPCRRQGGSIDLAGRGEAELKLAERLISDLSKDKFEADKFEDTYRQKILEIAKQKVAGQEISLPSAPKRGSPLARAGST